VIHPGLRVAALIAREPPAPSLTAALTPHDLPCFASPEHFLGEEGVEPGLVLVGPDESLCAAAQLAGALRGRGGDWVVVLVESGGTDRPWVGRPVTVGYRQELGELIASAVGPAPMPLLELTPLLARVAKARHDINNPLTSALAESQLLLLDVQDDRVRQAVETIQRQVRRIRDLVAELEALRQPTPP
jgi:signal transduction histidine kinase